MGRRGGFPDFNFGLILVFVHQLFLKVICFSYGLPESALCMHISHTLALTRFAICYRISWASIVVVVGVNVVIIVVVIVFVLAIVFAVVIVVVITLAVDVDVVVVAVDVVVVDVVVVDVSVVGDDVVLWSSLLLLLSLLSSSLLLLLFNSTRVFGMRLHVSILPCMWLPSSMFGCIHLVFRFLCVHMSSCPSVSLLISFAVS